MHAHTHNTHTHITWFHKCVLKTVGCWTSHKYTYTNLQCKILQTYNKNIKNQPSYCLTVFTHCYSCPPAYRLRLRMVLNKDSSLQRVTHQHSIPSKKTWIFSNTAWRPKLWHIYHVFNKKLVATFWCWVGSFS